MAKNSLEHARRFMMELRTPSAQLEPPFCRIPCQCFDKIRISGYHGKAIKLYPYNGGALQHGTLCELVDNIDLEVITLRLHCWLKCTEGIVRDVRTLVPVISVLSTVPPARTASLAKPSGLTLALTMCKSVTGPIPARAPPKSLATVTSERSK